MKKLYDAVQRFCARHPRFGIPNLMLYIVAGNVIVYLLMMFTQRADANALAFLSLNTAAVLRGELWRIVTYVFVPGSSNLFMLLISLYFYYWIGSTLERQWGTPKFTLYYISGVLLTAVGVLVASLISGQNYVVSGSAYVNLSMFFAYATLFPDTYFLLFFFFPVKVKWLAIIDAAVFALGILFGSFPENLLPLVALLNYFVFCGEWIGDLIGRGRVQRQKNVVDFQKEARRIQREMKDKPYNRKCEVCGRTDTDYPDLEFRYCSRCAGYHCYCVDHINNHVHHTE